ncbi:MAG: hypothetical protein LBI77_04045 [Puniceicoccales bacterium]|jgi:hypothetical protein|nr:hypothetical protein [Puniceicoccales bacterium]
MNRRGYLLIEVIIGLSIFALTTGAITQGFLLGLKMYKMTDSVDPNEAVITTTLINRIKSSMDPTGSSIVMKFGKNETWKLELRQKTSVANISPSLCYLKIVVTKTRDSEGTKIDQPEEKEYTIFRHLS